MYCTIKLAIFLTAFVTSISVQADSQIDQNKRALKSLLVPHTITALEWELLQFNVNVNRPITNSISYDYVNTSPPVLFDSKLMKLHALFFVKDKRDHDDSAPFFKLSRSERESILQSHVDELITLLELYFPDIKNIRSLFYAEFSYRSSGGGAVIIAKYENGALSLNE
jgi:hypothetical protein